MWDIIPQAAHNPRDRGLKLESTHVIWNRFRYITTKYTRQRQRRISFRIAMDQPPTTDSDAADTIAKLTDLNAALMDKCRTLTQDNKILRATLDLMKAAQDAIASDNSANTLSHDLMQTSLANAMLVSRCRELEADNKTYEAQFSILDEADAVVTVTEHPDCDMLSTALYTKEHGLFTKKYTNGEKIPDRRWYGSAFKYSETAPSTMWRSRVEWLYSPLARETIQVTRKDARRVFYTTEEFVDYRNQWDARKAKAGVKQCKEFIEMLLAAGCDLCERIDRLNRFIRDRDRCLEEESQQKEEMRDLLESITNMTAMRKIRDKLRGVDAKLDRAV